MWFGLSSIPRRAMNSRDTGPAVVLSPASYNGKTGLMVCCPMTTRIKGYPLRALSLASQSGSAVLSDQVKNLDWRARRANLKVVPARARVTACQREMTPVLIG